MDEIAVVVVGLGIGFLVVEGVDFVAAVQDDVVAL